MNREELRNNPEFDNLINLARTFGLDEALLEECALGTITRVCAALKEGYPLSEDLIIGAVNHWIQTRQEMHQRYIKDASYRQAFNAEIINQLWTEK